MSRTCYHCHSREAQRNSAFCAECNHGRPIRPMFFPTPRTRRNPALTRLLYTGATAAAVWAIYKTFEAWMQP